MWFNRAALGRPVVPEVKMWSSVSVDLQEARMEAGGGRAVDGSSRGVANGGVCEASMQTGSGEAAV